MLEARDLAVRLGAFALGPLDLSFGDGVTAVVGPNGGGKSTLLRLLAGVLAPDAGLVACDGEPLAELVPRARAARVAYAPQEPPAAPGFTLGDFVAMGAYHRLRAWHRAPAAETEAALALVDLAGKGGVPFAALSGGEKKRAGLAQAVVQDAGTLLLDEPNSFVDYAHNARLARLVRELAARGKRVVIVSHDATFLAAIASRFVALRDGLLYAATDRRGFLDRKFLEGLFDARFTVDVRRGIVQPKT